MSVDFNPRYVSSVAAGALNIKGKPTKFSVKSGLPVRPLVV